MFPIVYERKKREITPEQARLLIGCPCFEETKAPHFTLDTLLGLLSDFSQDMQALPYTLEIPMNGLIFVFRQASLLGSRVYYLARAEKVESTQQQDPHTYQQ